MPVHLQREIESLKKKIISLGAVVERVVWQATESIEQRDASLAAEVIRNDVEIDHAEVEVEEDCLKILALYQPVATDLRFIIAVLKLNNDLERIGDLAVNIAQRAQHLATVPRPEISFDFYEMSSHVQNMLKRSLGSLVNLSVEDALGVCNSDNIVDSMNRQMYKIAHDAAKKNPDQMENIAHLASVSRHLERIADHATNIAEDVIYMIKGRIVRHSPEKYLA